MYKLIEILYKESKNVAIVASLVNLEKITKFQQQKYRNNNEKIFELYQKYRSNQVSAVNLLFQASYLINPSITVLYIDDDE